MKEPSVLDYIKAKLSFGRIQLPEPEQMGTPEGVTAVSEVETAAEPAADGERAISPAPAQHRLPLRTLAAFLLALAAQINLEPPGRNVELAVSLYVLAAGLLIWAIVKSEWGIVALKDNGTAPIATTARFGLFWLIVPLLAGVFLLFQNHLFTTVNMLLWGIVIALTIRALWIPSQQSGDPWYRRLWRAASGVDAGIRITPWQLMLFAAFLLSVFFRFYWLDQVPGEMFSDHAEKLLDVADVLSGQAHIFFPRNTGREAFQMYLTATMARLFDTGLSFMSLKIGTALAGLFTLPFIYLLGKEIGNRWVGLLALVLAGMAYWPNVISRVGLRFPLYALFAAPLLYFLIRGLKNANRNDLVLAGLALGIGLHGYSPMRIVPFIVLIAVGIYSLHSQSRGKRMGALWGLVTLAFVAFVVFLPLFRFMVDDPNMFGYRALSRLGTTERDFPAPVGLIFLENTWRSMIMFFYDNGGIWVHSIVGRPALDVITAVSYFAGTIGLLVRYIRRRHWLDLFLVLSVPLLMLPSILSLAYPEENPSLNRSSAAIVPVFIIAALGLEGLLSALMRRVTTKIGRAAVIFVGLALVLMAANANFNLVFDQYKHQFLGGAWNTSQIGKSIRAFSDTIGTHETAHVVPYPHWVDTRLVGINAGYPLKDYALWRDEIATTLNESRAQLFVVKPEDVETQNLLDQLYPDGAWQLMEETRYQGRNFLLFFVPPRGDERP
ncbi:MAG TPA: glycosyltransferase family 39 protein [Levilinea sp.]|nr:glycosyltransferase family 39 protein [Levilinea sp.]